MNDVVSIPINDNDSQLSSNTPIVPYSMVQNSQIKPVESTLKKRIVTNPKKSEEAETKEIVAKRSDDEDDEDDVKSEKKKKGNSNIAFLTKYDSVIKIALISVLPLLVIVVPVLMFADTAFQATQQNKITDKYVNIENGVLSFTNLVQRICIGAGLQSCSAFANNPSVRMVIEGEISVKLSGVTIKQLDTGDFAIYIGTNLFMTWLSNPGVFVVGQGQLSDTMTQSQIDSLTYGSTIFTGLLINGQDTPDWRRTSVIQLGIPGYLLYQVQHTRISALSGIQIVSITNPDHFITLPSTSAFPGMYDTPKDSDITSNTGQVFLVGSQLVAPNVIPVDDYACVDTSLQSICSGSPHMVLRTWQNGMHTGFNDNSPGSRLDSPLPSGCFLASDYQMTILPVIQQLMSSDSSQPYTDMSYLFTGTTYYMIFDPSCTNACTGGNPENILLSFYQVNTCTSVLGPVRTINIDLRQASAGQYQLLCST